MAKKRIPLSPDEPLRHPDHPRPVTRREFIRQGFMTGSAVVAGGAMLNMFLPQDVQAALSADISTLGNNSGCPVGVGGNLKIPFICFDLAGGANFAGSNVLVGGAGGQDDLLSTAGYSKMGIPGSRVPGLTDASGAGNGDFTDSRLGLKFHSQSALLAGIMDMVSPSTAANVNGFVIPARSDNDTSNNPHNPMYGIAHAGPLGSDSKGIGAKGSLLTLIGSVASDSGGNSMAPAGLMDATIRPTKVSRPSDVTGLVDTGNLIGILSQDDAVSVMETVARISNAQIGNMNTGLASAADITLKKLLNCGYVKAADIANQFGSPSALDPLADTNIQNIFSAAGLSVSSDTEYQKAASVMKLVVGTFAGAGTITMGGYDYHTGDRTTGEKRDIRAGRCIGACLEYAALLGKPLMIYVFSDGSLFSNGTPDSNGVTDGRIVLPAGKGVWTGDNSSTACTFALVYNPGGPAQLTGTSRQIGYFRASGDVETAARTSNNNPIVAANNVTALVNTLLLNYMALHGEQAQFSAAFPQANMAAPLDELTVFQPIVNSTIDNPV